MKTISITLGFLVAILLLQGVQGYVIEGDTVYWENAYGKIAVWPHTDYNIVRHEQYANITSYLPTQDFDFAVQFDNPIAGNIYLWNGSGWRDRTYLFEHEVFNDSFNDRYFYWIKNVNFQQDETKQIKWVYYTIPNTTGKWEMWIKRSTDTIQEALNSSYYVNLDPWWNSSYNYSINITIQPQFNTVNEVILLPMNFTALGLTKPHNESLALVNASCNVTGTEQFLDIQNETLDGSDKIEEVTLIFNITSQTVGINTTWCLYYDDGDQGQSYDEIALVFNTFEPEANGTIPTGWTEGVYPNNGMWYSDQARPRYGSQSGRIKETSVAGGLYQPNISFTEQSVGNVSEAMWIQEDITDFMVSWIYNGSHIAYYTGWNPNGVGDIYLIDASSHKLATGVSDRWYHLLTRYDLDTGKILAYLDEAYNGSYTEAQAQNINILTIGGSGNSLDRDFFYDDFMLLKGNLYNSTERSTIFISSEIEQIPFPHISIDSPENTTYYNINELGLEVENVSFVADVWWYSLNNESNVTFIPDINLTSMILGGNILFVYANDTGGDLYSANVTFTLETACSSSSHVYNTTCAGLDMNYVAICKRLGLTTFQWDSNNLTFCPYGCFNGQCLNPVTTCRDRCEINQTACSGNYILSCINQTDGCFDWTTDNRTFCRFGCVDGICLEGVSLCTYGERRCQDNVLVYCDDDTGDGFYEWSKFNFTNCRYGCIETINETTGTVNVTCNIHSFDLPYDARNTFTYYGRGINYIFDTYHLRLIFVLFGMLFVGGLLGIKTGSWIGGLTGILFVGFIGLIIWIPALFYIFILLAIIGGAVLLFAIR